MMTAMAMAASTSAPAIMAAVLIMATGIMARPAIISPAPLVAGTIIFITPVTAIMFTTGAAAATAGTMVSAAIGKDAVWNVGMIAGGAGIEIGGPTVGATGAAGTMTGAANGAGAAMMAARAMAPIRVRAHSRGSRAIEAGAAGRAITPFAPRRRLDRHARPGRKPANRAHSGT
ncbi:MAG: hypothetical protein A2X69_17870 [Rhodobacteraceae bacterium GWF1_65_7]|nr:MAG: hypothetical protein A2X69_17870 [Rhodobacteraceae bacterium GWF1_65_7]